MQRPLRGIGRRRYARLGRRAVGRVFAERLLPPADVAPGAELERDVAEAAASAEAERLVQGDAGVVGERDPGARLVVALLHEQGEQPLVERAADAAGVRRRW